MAQDLPSKAEVLIVGGGIAGCSIAYHLTKLGITDVLLCERRQLGCGTTWHAAGLVTQLRATRNMTELAKYTGELFRALEAETGQATGFKQNGSLRLAKTEGASRNLKRGASMGRSFGLPVDVIAPGRDQGALAAHRHGRHRRRPVAAEGRTGQPGRRDAGLCQRRAGRRRPHRRGHEGERILVEGGRAVGA